MTSLRSWIDIVESNNSASDVKSKILSAIEKCNKHFGENFLFYGNCGIFSIALSHWIQQHLQIESGLAGVIVVYNDDPEPLPLAKVNLGRTFTHVFSFVTINGKECLFDGTGEVSHSTLDKWFEKTKAEYDPDDDDDDETPAGIELVTGPLDDRCIMVVIEGTDHSGDWHEIYDFMIS